MFSRSFAGIVSDSYGRRGCKGEESFGGKVWIIGVENKPNHSDESFPDVVVAVGQPIGEVEQVAHPHRDLGYFALTTDSEEDSGTSAAILVDNRCRGSDSRVVMYADREWDTTDSSAERSQSLEKI